MLVYLGSNHTLCSFSSPETDKADVVGGKRGYIKTMTLMGARLPNNAFEVPFKATKILKSSIFKNCDSINEKGR